VIYRIAAIGLIPSFDKKSWTWSWSRNKQSWSWSRDARSWSWQKSLIYKTDKCSLL